MLTLDSSVIIAALRKQEQFHGQCKELLEQVKNGKYVALEPYTVLVEIVSAIKRRTNSEALAEKVQDSLLSLGTMYFLELEAGRTKEAADIAKSTGVRGMDAVVAQIAKEFDASLVSLDEDMITRLKKTVRIRGVEELVR